MIRKILFAVGGMTVLTFLLFGRNSLSYVRTSAGWVKDSVKNSVPLDFEIDRARKMVADLVPDIRKNMHVIAKEEVEVQRLSEQIAKSEEKLERDRADLLRMKNDVASNKEVFQYAGRTYSPAQVKTDLANRFERFKTTDATVASLRDIRTAREKSLAAARQKLDGMLAAKRKLEADVENLEARLKMVEVAQTTSSFNFDDSNLGRCKDLVADLRTRLDVSEKMLNADSTYTGEIPLDEAAPKNIVEQVTEYLTPSATKVADAKTAGQK